MGLTPTLGVVPETAGYGLVLLVERIDLQLVCEILL